MGEAGVGDLRGVDVAAECEIQSTVTFSFPPFFHSSLLKLPQHKISTAHGGARRLGVLVPANLSKADERITLCFAAL